MYIPPIFLMTRGAASRPMIMKMLVAEAKVMLKKYPDIMTIDQMCSVLGISTKTGYKLIHNGTIDATKVGRSFRIPKIHLLAYLKVVARNEKKR